MGRSAAEFVILPLVIFLANTAVLSGQTTYTIDTFAGNGMEGFSGDGGPATSASLDQPAGMTFDAAGNLYFADSFNYRVRKVSGGNITTVAGNGSFFMDGAGDGGPATSAEVSPVDVAIDAKGNLYIAAGNIREVSNGIINTIVGQPFHVPPPPLGGLQVASNGISIDSSGNLYLADPLHDRILKYSNGISTVVAGTDLTAGFSGDNGPATSATFNQPLGIAVDSSGNLYIADSVNNRIRMVSGGIITTIAGDGTAGFSGDGGPATSAELNNPSGVAVDSKGNLYIADTNNNRVREVSRGVISTIAGLGLGDFFGDGGLAVYANLYYPTRVALDQSGNIYVADSFNFRIRILKPYTGSTPPLLITTTSLPTGMQGQPYGPVTLMASGGSDSYSWSSSPLPPGMTLTAAGVLSGTPTLSGSSQNTFTVTSGGTTGLVILTLNVIGPITILNTALPNGTAGQPYATITFIAEGGLNGSYSWSATGLPAGLTLSTVGILNGTPTVSGSFSVTVSATNSGVMGSATFPLTIAAAGPLTITNTSLPSGAIDQSYDVNFFATGGLGNYSWSATGLPPGLTMTTNNGAGLLSGGPTQQGTFPVTITVNSAGSTASITLPLVIGPQMLVITTFSLPPGFVTHPYGPVTLTAINGSGSYDWSAIGVPPGLTMTSAGVISGTPTTAGTYTITVSVSSGGQTGKAMFNVMVTESPVSINTTSLGVGILNLPFGPISLMAANGSGAYSWSASGLPPGIIVTPGGVMSGTPSVAGVYSAGIFVLSGGSVASVTLPLIIAQPSSTSQITYTITTVAGGTFGFSGDGGPALSAGLSAPSGVAVDSEGNFYFADTFNNRVRKVSNGVIETVAGNGTEGFAGDGGPATGAELSIPDNVALDSEGNLYIVDYGNYCIRKVSNGIITTLVGGPLDSKPAAGVELTSPSSVAIDTAGNVFIVDSGTNSILKYSSGHVTVVAGTGTRGFSGDGGPAVEAELNGPIGLALDAAGNVYIADAGNSRIREISGGAIKTVAGNGTKGFNGDDMPAVSAEFDDLSGIAVDSTGNIYITDGTRIREISNGILNTIAGNGTKGFSGDSGPGTIAELAVPTNVAVDSSGKVYVADDGSDRIRLLTPGPSGALTILTTSLAYGSLSQPYAAIQLQAVFGSDGYTWSAAGLPPGLTLTSQGVLSGTPTTSGQFSITFTVASGGNKASTALHLIIAAAGLIPSITAGGIVPLDSTMNTIQPGEWISIYGSNLGVGQSIWEGNFPAALGGASVTINGNPGYLSYVSPSQIDLQAPDDTTVGPVSVQVKTLNGTVNATVTLAQTAPSFCLLDSKHVAGIILRLDGSGAYGGGSYDIIGPTGNSLGYSTVAAKAGDTISLFAVGFGPTSPVVLAGQPFSGAAPTSLVVTLLINKVNVVPTFSGLSSAGLYQINLTVPAGLGSGDVPIEAIVGGAQSPSGVLISLE
jgi:uncharacterized protein (TIGR03437 family)